MEEFDHTFIWGGYEENFKMNDVPHGRPYPIFGENRPHCGFIRLVAPRAGSRRVQYRTAALQNIHDDVRGFPS
jgi:hypothetical protein